MSEVRDPTADPFERTEHVEEPSLLGAKWWRDAREEAQVATTSRRKALHALLAGGGLTVVTASLSLFGVGCCDDDEDEGTDYKEEKRSSLAVQRQFGWNFGSIEKKLTFDGKTTANFDKGALARMPTELSPAGSGHRPFFTPTLFQSPTALPKSKIAGQSPKVPLADALTPIFTPSMKTAYGQGRGLASLFKGKQPATMAIVDMKGPESVAFAAGMANVFDPVFTFDNWPHPVGVVKAHLTLAAAAYYQPLFAKLRAARPANSPAAFVLDRDRLAPYTNENKQFDNRYVVKLPTIAQLKKMGVKHIIYVVPTAADRLEIDDLNSDFVEYKKAGIDVKMSAAADFRADPGAKISEAERKKLEAEDGWPPYYYGGDDGSHDSFYEDYGWSDVGADGDTGYAKRTRTAARNVSQGKTYSPNARSTMFSSSKSTTGGSTTKTSSAPGFGATAVAVAVGTGAVLGARHAASKWGGGRTSGGRGRTGSFGRSGGRTGGG